MNDKNLSNIIQTSVVWSASHETAEEDYLTKLANRRGLYDYYSSLNKKGVIHAMFIDIDNFKRVNDIYGHSMGDKLLIEISSLIQKHAIGFTSRIGGDEYVVIQDGSLEHEKVEQIATALIDNIDTIDFRPDILSLVSLSVGIVFDQSLDQPLDDILAKCDSAMYRAKSDGKRRFSIYQSFDHTLEISRNIEFEMEDALATGQFHVYLQPKVNMITNKLYGAEALSRWVHPTDGVRAPALYIPLFQKNGFIAKLDLYVFEEVCRLKASWEGKKYQHIPISVNMSRLHLYNKHFTEDLENIANKYGIPTNELELEITESTFIKDTHELIQAINLLQSRGFLVSIDDFGSGFSALNLLKDMTIDTVKLDKDFLQLSSHTARGKTVIRSVIMMCRDLKINVVTEGIETKEQVDFIMRCGCPIAQGFYYAKPLPVPEFIEFADEHLTDIQTNFHFPFNGSLDTPDHAKTATFVGPGTLCYAPGIYKDSLAVQFEGGKLEENVIEVPPEVLCSDSFSVSMWIYPEQTHFWSCALYIKCETGFFAICPVAWESHSDFRIRDSREVNGWYDLSGLQLQPNIWWHYCITYNAMNETATASINGVVVSRLENVPVNHFVKRILIGGDVFQPSFIGRICEVRFYNDALDFDEIKELHQSYIDKENFAAFPITVS